RIGQDLSLLAYFPLSFDFFSTRLGAVGRGVCRRIERDTPPAPLSIAASVIDHVRPAIAVERNRRRAGWCATTFSQLAYFLYDSSIKMACVFVRADANQSICAVEVWKELSPRLGEFVECFGCRQATRVGG